MLKDSLYQFTKSRHGRREDRPSKGARSRLGLVHRIVGDKLGTI
jgi:hypothetical protein